MNCSRDIITLQIGHFSNFIGAHWWNLQEASFVYDKKLLTDINHDFLFRETISITNQESYTPRLLIIDKKGSLGSLSLQGNSLHETKTTSVTANHASWSGDVEATCQFKVEKNEYLQFLEEEQNKLLLSDEDKDVCLDETPKTNKNLESPKSFNLSDKVNVWSDFLRPYLHPDTIYCLKEIWHQNQGDGWGFLAGEELMHKTEPLDEIIDRIRRLAESCSCLQGFQLLSDGYNEMGGVGLVIAQHLEDDYKSKDLFSFVSSLPNNKPKTAQDIAIYVTSLIQSYTELSKLSSMVVPLNMSNEFWKKNSEVVKFPHINYKCNNNYEASSLLGCFMDTVTMPYRSKTSPLPMNYFSHHVTPQQMKIVGGNLGLPLGVDDCLNVPVSSKEGNDFDYRSISGKFDSTLNPISEHRIIRGLPMNKLDRRKYGTSRVMYDQFLREKDSVSRIVHEVSDPLNITPPFPQIFTPTVNEYGLLKTKTQLIPSIVTRTPAAAALNQGNGVGIFLRKLLESAKNIDVSKVPRLIEEDLDKERWNDALEDLRNIVQQYNLPGLGLSDTDSE